MALAIFVVAGPARAQSVEAEALFSDGNNLMAEGKLAQACEAFETSNRVEPRAGTLIRLGECREQNQQLASAWSAYKDALTRVKDPYKREVATTKVVELELRLSYLMVAVSDQSRFEGLTLTRNGRLFDPMLWNRSLPVDGGDYIITGRAPNHEEWQTTVHVALESAKVSVEVPKLKELSKPTLPPTPKSPSVTGPHDQGAKQSQGLFTMRRKISIGVASTSVISAVAGVVFGTIAKVKQNDAFELCRDPAMSCPQAAQSNALLQSSHDRAFEANVAFGIAAAAAIGAGMLWFTGAPDVEKTARVSVTPRLAAGESSVVITGSF